MRQCQGGRFGVHGHRHPQLRAVTAEQAVQGKVAHAHHQFGRTLLDTGLLGVDRHLFTHRGRTGGAEPGLAGEGAVEQGDRPFALDQGDLESAEAAFFVRGVQRQLDPAAEKTQFPVERHGRPLELEQQPGGRPQGDHRGGQQGQEQGFEKSAAPPGGAA